VQSTGVHFILFKAVHWGLVVTQGCRVRKSNFRTVQATCACHTPQDMFSVLCSHFCKCISEHPLVFKTHQFTVRARLSEADASLSTWEWLHSRTSLQTSASVADQWDRLPTIHLHHHDHEYGFSFFLSCPEYEQSCYQWRVLDTETGHDTLKGRHDSNTH
jgi:hypothetical protein